ncbi:flagellar basal body protein FliL [Sphingomonas sp. MAH-20]|uniref:Flagellar protein FliL n=1 Tax=Sphingomonas horti TaxID=2682842 RepID=A0A6I4J4I3_9SPHN|nr:MULTISPECIES: flagellar basal body-associated FliL family protein [Sphingomonas]MBA2918975.1 flagellar basal body-associated FliL family protein [Sphingomonas sp. CGMCC 1.13658]MVO79008.1 flagellar basal body protein FliL [Sphingomonas horti]
MATAATPEAAAPKKKGKKGLITILAALVLAGAGVGGGIFLASSGMIGSTKAAEPEGKDLPKLLPKGSKPAKKEGEEGGHGGGGESAEGPKYESSYFQMEKEFTSNLKDSVHLIQVGLAVSTPYDEKVIEHLQAHELAVRSAVLMTLADTDEEQIFTPEGKKDLQRRLAKAINDVLKEKEGFGGVANVYFTNFIVQ